MDFKGQALADRIGTILITLFGILAFLLGYWFQNFILMISIYAGGVLLALLLCGPDWPMYNTNPLHWLPPTATDSAQTTSTASRPIRPKPRRESANWKNLYGWL